MRNPDTTFFCGIGGSGMSALAQVLRHRGMAVAGSDRSFDQGDNGRIREALLAQGVRLFPQDGSGISPETARVIVSTAVEPTIPDVRAALDRQIPVQRRAELLAELFHQGEGIAIAGTSGKSTVTAMVGHILEVTGQRPTVINGAVMIGKSTPPSLGNVLCGDAALPVIEADESDGSIALYRPHIGLITNISLDHKPMAELHELFTGFAAACCHGVVRNADCPESRRLPRPVSRVLTFGITARDAEVRATDVQPLPDGIRCLVNGHPLHLRLLGTHNVANAAAAIAAAVLHGIPLREAVAALATFAGVERRLQILGERNGIMVLDDFAHNPDKIAASLAALRAVGRRLIVMFQPHGFGPTRFLRQGLVAAFVAGLGDRDHLVMPEIYYAGGTASQDISSRDLVRDIAAGGRHAHFFPGRSEVEAFLRREALPGDLIVIMGARDNTLTDFARRLLNG